MVSLPNKLLFVAERTRSLTFRIDFLKRKELIVFLHIQHSYMVSATKGFYANKKFFRGIRHGSCSCEHDGCLVPERAKL